MQNSNQSAKDFGAMRLLTSLTNLSPLFIISTMVLPLLVMGIVQVSYYSSILYINLGYVGYFLAFLIAIATQTSRLAFGLAGARDIAQRKFTSGILGLFATFAVAIFEQYEVFRIAQHWTNLELSYLFSFCIWLAVGAEIRLMLSIPKVDISNKSTKNEKKQKPQKRQQKPQPQPTETDNDLPFGIPDFNMNFAQNGSH